MAIRDDFSFQTKANLLQTVRDLIKNPMELTPGQCPSAMSVALTDKIDESQKIATMRCHLLVEHDGDHEHYGHNESVWFWKE